MSRWRIADSDIELRAMDDPCIDLVTCNVSRFRDLTITDTRISIPRFDFRLVDKVCPERWFWENDAPRHDHLCRPKGVRFGKDPSTAQPHAWGFRYRRRPPRSRAYPKPTPHISDHRVYQDHGQIRYTIRYTRSLMQFCGYTRRVHTYT